jgi:signal transduction histidine kinase
VERTTEETANAALALHPPRAAARLAHERPVAHRIVVALASVVLAVALRWPLEAAFGAHVPFATFYLAVAASALYGGLSAGLLAAGGSALAVSVWLHASTAAVAPAHLALFLLASVILCGLQEIVHRAALASARYAEDLRKASAFSAALADAATVEEVAAVALREGRAVAFARDGALWLHDPDRRVLRPIAGEGTGEEIPLDDRASVPFARALREGAASWSPGRDGALDEVVLPLLAEGRALGVLSLQLEPRGRTSEDRALLSSLGRQIGHALDRARLFEGEHLANARLAVLAEVGRVLGSLPLPAIPAALARVLVPGFADACLLELYDEAGAVVAVEALHADPSRARAIRAAGVASVESSLRALVEARGSTRLSEASLGENRALVARLGDDIGALLIAPIRRDEGLLGALALAMTSGSRRVRAPRRYGDEDLTLAEEVAARAAVAVEQARLHDELQAAVRIRDDFLSIASHELNTPLTPLKMHLGALRRGRSDPTKTEERLAALDRQVDRLAQLVGQLLDVSRIAAGSLRVDREPVDLAAVVRESAQRLEGPLRASGSELRLSTPERLVGLWDPMRLDQIATNLLGNAIKYGERRPIEVTVEPVDGKAVRLQVRDHGIGIAREHLDRIFGRFERAVSVRHFGGFGLGLWIVRQVVEALGGTIEVESAPGEGATFTVVLPRGEPAADTLLH